jgi:hypothetical protein
MANISVVRFSSLEKTSGVRGLSTIDVMLTGISCLLIDSSSPEFISAHESKLKHSTLFESLMNLHCAFSYLLANALLTFKTAKISMRIIAIFFSLFADTCFLRNSKF